MVRDFFNARLKAKGSARVPRNRDEAAKASAISKSCKRPALFSNNYFYWQFSVISPESINQLTKYSTGEELLTFFIHHAKIKHYAKHSNI